MTQQKVAFLKVAPQNMVNPASIEDIEDDDEPMDAETSQMYELLLRHFADSNQWAVARTIYLSVTMAGKITIDNQFDRSKTEHANADSILNASIDSLDLT